MDKDSIILKYEQEELKDVEKGVCAIRDSNKRQADQLDVIQDKIKQAYAVIGKKPLESKQDNLKIMNSELEERSIVSVCNYDDLYEKARFSLIERGLDVDSLDYHDLVSDSELREIEKELNRPLSRRERWSKNDFIAVFIAASIGSLADVVLGNRNNKFTGTDSAFSDLLNQFHKHDGALQ